MPAVIHRNPARTYDDRDAVVASQYEDAYEEGTPVIANLARLIAVATAAALTILGLVAVARIDWDAGMDAASVRVADMPFTPEVAIATVVLGVLALICAAAWLSDLRLAMGAVLVAIGVAILLVNSDSNELELVDRHGWLLVGIGAALAIAGLLGTGGLVARRTVAQRRYMRDEPIDLR